MRKSEITSFFKIFNQIQEVVNSINQLVPYQYNVRIKEITQPEQIGAFENIKIVLDIFNDYDAEIGIFFPIHIGVKFLDGKHQKELEKLIEVFSKTINTELNKIKAA